MEVYKNLESDSEFLKNIVENVEIVLRKKVKKQTCSGIIYVPKELIGKEAIIIVLK